MNNLELCLKMKDFLQSQQLLSIRTKSWCLLIRCYDVMMLLLVVLYQTKYGIDK